MPQGALKKKKPAVEKKIQKRQGSGQKKKGLQDFKPRKQSLSDKLNRKLTSEIRNNIEKSTADRFHQGGGKLSVLKL
eukprot:CAMPEP_0196727496 /NCGR_PEP_ID=MMETSP1091-20130531/8456_1 /TAXON_ID=302021 /ORGANISM="Rhodomonas sp., Strain CCMP768" /LENGTH=76 /DNA_ID=CAMNT_0042070097 /DNA_START=12 /DNA_END=242 /DNA_ORIENTATION=-